MPKVSDLFFDHYSNGNHHRNEIKMHVISKFMIATTLGGIDIDVNKYNAIELEKITRRYATELFTKKIMSPESDVPGPDM